MNTVNWLTDASYSYLPKRQELKVNLPNGKTCKELFFYGEDQCNVVRCLLDALMPKATVTMDAWKAQHEGLVDLGGTISPGSFTVEIEAKP